MPFSILFIYKNCFSRQTLFHPIPDNLILTIPIFQAHFSFSIPRYSFNCLWNVFLSSGEISRTFTQRASGYQRIQYQNNLLN